jgi:hypothetical protein
MKFAIRDDDLNYFFNPEVIENNYRDIWDICSISMSVVPFIKGNRPYWLEYELGIISKEMINELEISK